MVNLRKKLENCKHPNSRKIKALTKQAKRMSNKHKSRLGHAIRCNILGEKLNWFRERIGDRTHPLTPHEFDKMMNLYLDRFDDEVNQIILKQFLSKNRRHQHVSRLNVLKLNRDKESGEFYGLGMEMVNLCDPVKFQSLIQWDGNAINAQHIKLDLISDGMLLKLKRQYPFIVVTPCSDGEQSMDMPMTTTQ